MEELRRGNESVGRDREHQAVSASMAAATACGVLRDLVRCCRLLNPPGSLRLVSVAALSGYYSMILKNAF